LLLSRGRARALTLPAAAHLPTEAFYRPAGLLPLIRNHASVRAYPYPCPWTPPNPWTPSPADVWRSPGGEAGRGPGPAGRHPRHELLQVHWALALLPGHGPGVRGAWARARKSVGGLGFGGCAHALQARCGRCVGVCEAF